jgi:hypothetical protein
MRVRCFSLLLLAQWTVVSCAKRHNGIETGSACAIVSKNSRAAAATAFYGLSGRNALLLSADSDEAIPTVDAKLAYDCLTSVPLNTAAATDLVTSILPYLEWQSGELDSGFLCILPG